MYLLVACVLSVEMAMLFLVSLVGYVLRFWLFLDIVYTIILILVVNTSISASLL